MLGCSCADAEFDEDDHEDDDCYRDDDDGHDGDDDDDEFGDGDVDDDASEPWLARAPSVVRAVMMMMMVLIVVVAVVVVVVGERMMRYADAWLLIHMNAILIHHPNHTSPKPCLISIYTVKKW